MFKLTENILVKYLIESKEELQKVTWPSRKETIKYSVIVAILSLLAGIYFFAIDWILSLALEELIQLTQ